MKRILVVGNCGSGKSTFTEKLASILDIQAIHLDTHYYRKGWEGLSAELWLGRVSDLVNRPSWIMDGNYQSTLDFRLEKADTVIFLDIPVFISFFRVLKRTLNYYGKVRPGMPANCKERFDLGFLKYVLSYNWSPRKRLLTSISNVKSSIKVIRLNSMREVQSYLKGLLAHLLV